MRLIPRDKITTPMQLLITPNNAPVREHERSEEGSEEGADAVRRGIAHEIGSLHEAQPRRKQFGPPLVRGDARSVVRREIAADRCTRRTQPQHPVGAPRRGGSRDPAALARTAGPACPCRTFSWPSSSASHNRYRESPTCARTSHTCTDPPWGLTSFSELQIARLVPTGCGTLLRDSRIRTPRRWPAACLCAADRVNTGRTYPVGLTGDTSKPRCPRPLRLWPRARVRPCRVRYGGRGLVAGSAPLGEFHPC